MKAGWKDVAVPKPYPREFRDDVVRVAQGREPGVTFELSGLQDVESLFPITVNQRRGLFQDLIIKPAASIAVVITWSVFRRHQDAAKTSRHKRQALTEPSNSSPAKC